MGWLYLLLSIAFEIGWASSLKSTAGYSRLWPSVINTLLTIGGHTYAVSSGRGTLN
jgi:quaternary ammonium compound-resistance protein SugE